jgi:hypothetical protein
MTLRYGIDLHARGRLVVTCEVYDKLGDTSIPYQGFITSRDAHSVTLCVPTANTTKHRFSTVDAGSGYGFEGSAFAPRGWRILLSQLPKLDTK